MPTVSVVIPTFNREHYIGRALESVLNQTYTDYEIIIVDDGSTDRTEEIIRRYQETSGNIRYIHTTENKGAPAARNTGIREARGTYIAFQDSDDVVLVFFAESRIKRQCDCLPVVLLGGGEIPSPETQRPIVGLSMNRYVVNIHTDFFLSQPLENLPAVERDMVEPEADDI